MNTATPAPARRLSGRLAASLVVCAAVAVSVLGSAATAEAATGRGNWGVSKLTLTPAAPAVDFSTPGTTGVLSASDGDGTPPGTYTIKSGDAEKRVYTLPQGLKFQASACDQRNYVYSIEKESCTISADGRTVTNIWTWTWDDLPSFGQDYNVGSHSFPVVSTGPASGKATATYTPFPGLTTASPSTSWGAPTPAATGVSGPDGSGRYTLNGTGEAGDTIRVKDATGTEIGSTVVTSGGNWSVKLPQATDFTFTITQYKVGIASDPIQYTAAPVPAVNPVIGLGALGLLVAGGGALAIRQRRRPARL